MQGATVPSPSGGTATARTSIHTSKTRKGKETENKKLKGPSEKEAGIRQIKIFERGQKGNGRKIKKMRKTNRTTGGPG